MLDLDGNVTMRIGGKEYAVPPMTLRTLKVAWPIISRLSVLGNEQSALVLSDDGGMKLMELHAERVSLIAKVMASAVRAKDPSMTVDKLEEVMTYEETVEMLQAFNELLNVSGLEKASDPPQPPNGEDRDLTQAQAQTSEATGTPLQLN